MKINLKIDKDLDFVTIVVEEGLKTIEDLVNKYKEKVKYPVLAAKVNNKLVALDTPIEEQCEIEFLDIRNQGANLIYQNSLTLIYLRAVEDIVKGAEVSIENSLNKGLYTYISIKGRQITDEEVEEINLRMKELILGDVKINKIKIDRNKAMEKFRKWGHTDKAKLVNQRITLKYLTFYELDGYMDFFYSLMVPSTRYCYLYELRKYKKGVLLRFPHPSKPDAIPKYVDETKIYEAFAEASKWMDLLGILNVADLNEKVKNGQIREIIQLSEALHEKKVVEIAKEITKTGRRIILIAGPSSSGKTTFARRLTIQLKVNGLKPIYLSTDDYFSDREDMVADENGELNFEDLEAVDLELFKKDINGLLSGEEVDIPVFDFIEGKKIFGKRITAIDDNQPIIIEGIHALNKKLTYGIDDSQKFKIYISPFTQLDIDKHNRIPTTDARMLRRMVRDFKYRGYMAKDTIKDWPKVRAGEDKNIFPFSGEADVVFNSVHIYELGVLKKYAQPLLLNIDRSSPEYSEASRMLNFLKYFEVIEDDSMISNNSILREFIGGSIYG
ncbi:MAG: nucleoside kinase [Anaerovoracaceae bacterium]